MKDVVLVTGGSDGLGKEIAKQLSLNYQVVILSRDEIKTKRAAEELGVNSVVADVSDYSQVEKAVKEVLAKYQKIDVLINCAGVWIEGELDKNDPTQIKKVLEVNTLGTIYCCRAVVPAMKKQGQGRIINIISRAGLNAKPERSVYSASKWAVTGFTRCLSEDVGKDNIAVTGVYPGYMKTDICAKAGIDKDLTQALETKDVAKAIQFILSLPLSVHFLEAELKNLNFR